MLKATKNKLKPLFDAVEDITPEAAFSYKDGKFVFEELSTDQVIQLTAKVKPDYFADYDMTEPSGLLNIDALTSKLRRFRKNEQIQLLFNDGEVVVKSDRKSFTTRMIDEPHGGQPELRGFNWKHQLELPVENLREAAKDAKTVTKHFYFKDDHGLIATTESSTGNSYTYKLDEQNMDGLSVGVQTEFIEDITSTAGDFVDDVVAMFNNNTPVCIIASTDNVTLRWIIAPMVEGDE